MKGQVWEGEDDRCGGKALEEDLNTCSPLLIWLPSPIRARPSNGLHLGSHWSEPWGDPREGTHSMVPLRSCWKAPVAFWVVAAEPTRGLGAAGA